MDHPSVVPSSGSIRRPYSVAPLAAGCKQEGVQRHDGTEDQPGQSAQRACFISRRGSPDSRQMHCRVKDLAGCACARIPAPGEQKLRTRRVCWRPRAVVSRALKKRQRPWSGSLADRACGWPAALYQAARLFTPRLLLRPGGGGASRRLSTYAWMRRIFASISSAPASPGTILRFIDWNLSKLSSHMPISALPEARRSSSWGAKSSRSRSALMPSSQLAPRRREPSSLPSHRLWFSAKVGGRTRHCGRRGASGYRGNTQGRPRAGVLWASSLIPYDRPGGPKLTDRVTIATLSTLLNLK